MRELGPVKEPEDEKAPKKKPVKGGFLASWMRRENGGEPDAKLDEQDLVNPEQDALFNDGFSKRWHKLFSGTMPVDEPVATTKSDDDDTTTDTKLATVDTPSKTHKSSDDKPTSQKPDEAETAQVSSLMDEAREQVRKAAKSAEELKGEVEVQHDADHLTDKEITATVPIKQSVAKELEAGSAAAAAEDFDVFSSTADSDEQNAEPAADKTLDFEDMESTPAGSGEPLPPLKDTADKAAINVFPAKEPFPRVDPSEFAHQTDVEDNVEAPGAPTKGYRGLLIVDHPDRAMPRVSVPPSLPPEPEAFLPEIAASMSAIPGTGLPQKSPAYILPSKDTAKWPNPAKSRPVVGGKLKRNVQAMIDRPASNEISAIVDKIAAFNRQNERHKIAAVPTSVLPQSDADAITLTPASEPSAAHDTLKISETAEGAASVGSIINDSPLAEKAKTHHPAAQEPLVPIEPIQRVDEPELMHTISERQEDLASWPATVEATVEPETVSPAAPARPAPAPLYNPPVMTEFPVQPSMQLPVLSQPDRYRLAMQRGILSGLAVSGAIMVAYLFG
jgi:hypothetical protein